MRVASDQIADVWAEDCRLPRENEKGDRVQRQIWIAIGFRGHRSCMGEGITFQISRKQAEDLHAALADLLARPEEDRYQSGFNMLATPPGKSDRAISEE